MSSRPLTRRDLLRVCGGAAAAAVVSGAACTAAPPPPAFLGDCGRGFDRDPRAARLAWFTSARYGLFIHYGLYSLLERGEWVMFNDRIPVAEYAKLKDSFTANGFDADAIADLAVRAGMKYVNITTRHHDGFCLFRTTATDFNSLNSPARRDLFGELAEACRRRGLGLFAYYSYAMDWRHPYFFTRNELCADAMPAYEQPEPTHRFKTDADFRHYIDFCHHQLRELLTQYGLLAGVWFDPLMGYYCRPELFPIAETYALVRGLQPGCLISFKQGVNGDEDFAAPERLVSALARGGEAGARAWEKNRSKPIEICNTLQPGEWGYYRESDGKHKTTEEVLKILADAFSQNANLLLNTGPLPDGSIPSEDRTTLEEVGRRLRAQSRSGA